MVTVDSVRPRVTEEVVVGRAVTVWITEVQVDQVAARVEARAVVRQVKQQGVLETQVVLQVEL